MKNSNDLKFEEMMAALCESDIMDVGYWEEGIPEDIYDKYFDREYATVCKGLDPDKHRWYKRTTEVISIFGRLLGIRSVTDVYGGTDIVYMAIPLEFFEMEQVPSVTYKKISQ